MSEQIGVAVDLGVVPAPRPEFLNLRQLVKSAPAAAPQITAGVWHQGCKMNDLRLEISVAGWLEQA